MKHFFYFIFVFLFLGSYIHRQKRSYDDVISDADDFTDLWDPSTAIPMEKWADRKGDYVEK